MKIQVKLCKMNQIENKKLLQVNIDNNVKFGQYISIVTTILTVITFVIAICTPPLSGPFKCPLILGQVF